MTQPPNPWGSCFDAAAHNLLGNYEVDGLVVCHGVGIANREGEEGMRVAHAWLEFEHPEHGRVALDPIWLVFQKADEYRANLKAQNVVEYSKSQFMALWRLHDFPGPWDAHIKQFTRESLTHA